MERSNDILGLLSVMVTPVCCLILHNYYSIIIRIKQQRENKAISPNLHFIHLFVLRSFSSP